MDNYKKKRLARNLYLRGEALKAIAEQLDISPNTLTRWKQEGDWDKDKERLENTVNTSMLIVANLYDKAYQLSNKEDVNIEELNRYALAIDRFTPPKDDFAMLSELGKSLTLYLLEKQTDTEKLNEFIELYKDFSKWYTQKRLKDL